VEVTGVDMEDEKPGGTDYTDKMVEAGTQSVDVSDDQACGGMTTGPTKVEGS